MDRALRRPPAASEAEKDGRRLAWMGSFEPEGGVRAQAEALARESAWEGETKPMKRALGIGLSTGRAARGLGCHGRSCGSRCL